MMALQDRYLLGLDLGTSAVKLALVDSHGAIEASSRKEYPSINGEGGLVEQKTDDWIAAIVAAAQELKQKAGAEIMTKVVAVGLSAQMPTMAVLDENGKPYGNAVVWSDCRAQALGNRLLALFGRERHYERTGVVLDGHYIVPMFLYQRINDDNFPKEPTVMSAKDFIAYYLTEKIITDPSTASGYGVYSLEDGCWDKELCRIADVDPGVFPPIANSNQIAGRLLPERAEALGLTAGIPIINGGADSVCGVFGLGVMEGTICQMWGSSTAILGVTDSILLSPTRAFFTTPLLLKNTFAVEADIMSTGVSYAWAARLLKSAGMEKSVTELAKEVPAGSEGVMFYPFLAGGEQGILWDDTLRGTITGLGVQHDLSHIMRAIIEGMCYESRRCVEAFKKGGCDCKDILCTGAITADPFFMQTLSNILGHPCRAMSEASGSALGAALLAGAAVGIWDLDALESITHMNGQLYVPGKEKALYDRAYMHYVEHTRNARLADHK